MVAKSKSATGKSANRRNFVMGFVFTIGEEIMVSIIKQISHLFDLCIKNLNIGIILNKYTHYPEEEKNYSFILSCL